jgi:hypothetical protein
LELRSWKEAEPGDHLEFISCASGRVWRFELRAKHWTGRLWEVSALDVAFNPRLRSATYLYNVPLFISRGQIRRATEVEQVEWTI